MDKTLVILIFILLFSSFFAMASNHNQLSACCAPAEESLVLKNETVYQKTTNFSIIVLPDTQHYSHRYPHIFTNQTQWIVNNAPYLNVVFVSHLGDLVQNGDSLNQWQNAAESMGILAREGIPWHVLPGNHDSFSDRHLANYNSYFGVGNLSEKSWFGGTYPDGTNNNNFALFSGGGEGYLIFSFQYRPSASVLVWANETIARYPDRKVILATHGYLDLAGERREDGNVIWNSFVAPHADQVFLVLCGHERGEARRTDYINGYVVHQLLSNFQTRPNGGNGWLRILQFYPGESKILVRTYSPYLNSFESDFNSQFSLDYEKPEKQQLALLAMALIITFLTIGLIVFLTMKKNIEI